MTAENLDSLRRVMDKDLLERLARIEGKQNDSDDCAAEERTEIKLALQKILAWQDQYEPTLLEMSRILSAGAAIKLIVLIVVGTLGAIATAATAVDIVKRWLP